MNKNLKKLAQIVSAAMAIVGASFQLAAPLEGCTGIKLQQKDGTFVQGRTLEFGVTLPISTVVVPRGYSFSGTTPLGAGLKYESKYGAVGSIAFDENNMLDGLNEKGLGVGTFWFPGYADYTVATADNQAKALSPTDFPNWLLTQFSTIDEVKEAVANVVITPTVLKNWGPTPPPMHYLVSDKSGKSIVIEPVGGKLLVHDNPLGVLTNSPEFDWHMTNMRNFVSLTTTNAKPVTINGVTFEGFGQGTGLTGLPGDFSPPSRFVRATIFEAAAIPVGTSEEGVFQAFHILNQFDIPVGAIRETVNGVEYMDYTIMTVVRDAQTLKYYFRTFDDQNIRFIDLTKFDLNAKEIKKASTVGAQRSFDFTANLK